jgi:hypothetical protein
MRESTNRGAAIDISDFERRLRGSEPAKNSPRDPLSELARLMHGEDQNRASQRYDQIFAEEAPAPQQQSHYPEWRDEPPHADDSAFNAELRGGFAEGHHPQQQEPLPYQQPYFGGEPQRFEPHGAGQGQSQEEWPDDNAAYLDYGANGDGGHAAEAPRGERRLPKLRPWHAVAAIAVVAAGGIGWSFAHRGGVVGSREIATINAPDGPTKVRPEAEPEARVDRPDATVLDRQEVAPVKQVVSHQEQPVDPKVEPRAVKLGAGPIDAPHEAPVAVGPEPKKVKTVSVRPDGSVITSGAVPPAVVKATGAAAREAAEKKNSATPKSAAKPTTTPHADAKAPKPKLPQKVAAVDDAAAPAEADAAPPEPAQKIEKGAFAVQFGAATTEEEAHALVTKVAGKYASQLGGHKPTFKIAKVGDKTVYRVRVGGISKEAANAVCGKVKAGGGSCFVAGN